MTTECTTFESLADGRAFVLARELPARRQVLRKLAGRAHDEEGRELAVAPDAEVEPVGAGEVTDAEWVQRATGWRLVLCWVRPTGAVSRVTSMPEGPAPEPPPSQGPELSGTFDPQLEAVLLNNRGAALAATGQLDAAVGCYTQALRLDAGLAQAYGNRANALSRLGLHADSLNDYALALEHAAPTDTPIMRCNRALARRALGDLEGALEDLDVAIARDRHMGMARVARAGLHALAGRPALARADLLAYLESAPDGPHADSVRAALQLLERDSETNQR
jgi:tetratricopeptide (TPR) repeat protein